MRSLQIVSSQLKGRRKLSSLLTFLYFLYFLFSRWTRWWASGRTSGSCSTSENVWWSNSRSASIHGTNISPFTSQTFSTIWGGNDASFLLITAACLVLIQSFTLQRPLFFTLRFRIFALGFKSLPWWPLRTATNSGVTTQLQPVTSDGWSWGQRWAEIAARFQKEAFCSLQARAERFLFAWKELWWK